MTRLFGTDGIRGPALQAPLDSDTVYRVGEALALLLQSRSSRVLIGRDTRESGPDIVEAIAAGIDAGGAEAFDLGVAPTPAVAYLVRTGEFDAGIMVSASHNPYQDNGIKIFGTDGDKISVDWEERIEAKVAAARVTKGSIRADFKPNQADGSLVQAYLEHLIESLNGTKLRPMKIVLDLAHGAGHRLGPVLCKRLGIEVTTIGAAPDGQNINAGVGSTYPEAMAESVLRTKAEMGAALDGDGDRVLMVDERGRLIDGDAILLLCAKRLKTERRLGNDGIVATVMSNLALEQALGRNELHLRRTPVGDRHVAETMSVEGYRLGGEQSGHIIFADYAETGDGLLTLLQVLRVLSLEEGSLGELAYLEPSPQCLVNVRVRSRPPLETIPGILNTMNRVERELDGQGRILVRYSGTEPLLRIMLEGNDEKRIRQMAEDIARAARETIGAEE